MRIGLSIMNEAGVITQRGRVFVADEGISRRPVLFWFHEPFTLRWRELSAWVVADLVRIDRDGHAESIVNRTLELGARKRVYFVASDGNETGFQDLVTAVWRYVPDKETESLLSQVRTPNV